MTEATVKKRKRSKRRRKKIFTLTAFIIVVAALLCTLTLTVFFPVRKIVVTGNGTYSDTEIIKSSGINMGDNVLMISEEDAKLAIQKKLPFIDSIKISRELSGTVTISVVETAETYCFKIGESYFTTDDECRILKEYTEKPQGITFIDYSAAVGKGKIAKLEFGSKENEKFLFAVLAEIGKTNLTVDSIDLSNRFAITVIYGSKYTVNYGSDVYLKEKTAFFAEIVNSGKMQADSGRINLSDYSPDKPNAYFDNDKK